jgi:hypothetical protein
MSIVIPPDQNSRGRLAVATYFRDLGFAVVPFEKGKKRPSIKGWPRLSPAACDDAFLGRWWGNGHVHDIGVLVSAPLVIIDLDGPGEPEIAITWMRHFAELGSAPFEITSRGIHLWLKCSDMPPEMREEERITTALPHGIGAELFVQGRAVRTTPSGLASGGQYQFAQTGPIPEVPWTQLRNIFGLVEKTKARPGRPAKEKPWWASFTGAIESLDLVRLFTESEHLGIGELLDAETSKHAVLCPWGDTHSKPAKDGTPPDSSTVIMQVPGQWPMFKCLHAACAERGLRDILELTEGREPGLVNKCCERHRPLWKGAGDTAPDGRPRIPLPQIGREISAFAEEVGKVVGPKLVWFLREEEVTRVSEIRVGSSSYLGFRKVETTYARTAVEDFIQAGILSKDPKTDEQVFMPTTPSPDVMSATLAAPAFTNHLPIVSRVLEVPIPLPLAAGGHDLPVEGYDPRFQTYLRSGAPSIDGMSVGDAIQWLYRVHEGFCLADEQSGVHALARLLTPYVRGIMGFEHRPPVWLYSANRPRAGKDYCAGLAPLIYEGRYTEDAPLGTKSEETSKRLVSALRSGRRTMHFANLQGHLDDEYFIGAVTASVIGGRSLGRNGADDDLQLSNEIEFSLSANSGLTFRTDMEPRTRRISLFFAEENPNNRVFPIPDLHGWVLRHRRELLSAVATLVHTWLQAGAPNGPTPFSSFKRWGDVVGGIMAFHGLGDPCQPHADDDGCPADRETSAMIALFQVMYARRPEQEVAKADIYAAIQEQGADVDAFDYFGDLAGDKKAQMRFGSLLRRYAGRELAGISLSMETPGGRTQRARYTFRKGGTRSREVFKVPGTDLKNMPSENPIHTPKPVATLATLATSDNRNRQEEINSDKKIIFYYLELIIL